MASNYPSIVASLTNPNATDRLNSPSHSSIESAQNNEIVAIETFVGTTSSVVGTLFYDVRSSNSNGGGHVQTANKGGTGQISYNKGDILVGQSSSILSKVSSAGNPDGSALVLDSTQATGVKWGTPGNAPIVNIYSVQGTFTWIRPSVLNYIVVELIGGGGPGGSGTGTGVSGTVGSGGGPGGYTKKVIPAASILASQTVNVASSVLAGNNGNLSSFGSPSILSATGGSQGTNSASNTVGGFPGQGFGGDINSPLNGLQRGGTGVGYQSGSNFIPIGGGEGGTSQYGFGKGGDGTINGTGLAGNSGAVIITQY